MSVAVRREHLRNYLVACLADNVLTLADLVDVSSLWSKLTKTLTTDVREVAVDLVRRGVSNGAKMIGEQLMKLGKR